MAKRNWDMTSKHSLESAAEWLRKQAGALMVVVVRVEDSAIAVDPGMAPKHALERLLLEAPDLAKELNERRVAKRAEKARQDEQAKELGGVF